MIAALRAADFERALRRPPCARSAHFAAHRLEPASANLSTGASRPRALVVDECTLRLGMVVPKRHAPSAVRRNLVRRQIRATVRAHAAMLAPGAWVVRLRAPFDAERFASAASAVLRRSVRDELEAMLCSAS